MKFKAVRRDREGWAFGYLTQYQGKIYMSNEIIENPTQNDPAGEWIYTEHEVLPATVCRYTGLTLKNIDFYEGDIIEFDRNGVTRREVIEFRAYAFTVGLQFNFFLYELGDCFESFKVVGNIHENIIPKSND